MSDTWQKRVVSREKDDKRLFDRVKWSGHRSRVAEEAAAARAECLPKRAAKEAERGAEEARARAEEEQAERARAAHAAAVRARAEQLREGARAAEAEAAEAAAAEAAKAEAARLQALEVARERTQRRQQRDAIRDQERIFAREQRRAEEQLRAQKRQELLDKLAPQVERDPARLEQIPDRWDAEPVEKGQANLFPRHGFSVDQLMADSRY